MERRLKLVPFEQTWMTHPTLDVHAVYRRPKRDPVTYERVRDEYGFVVWDLAGALPLRSHYNFVQKGFEYVTLSTRADVWQTANHALAEKGTVPLDQPEQYVNQPNGPWHTETYFADCEDEKQARIARILLNINQYGLLGAESFERQTDPGFTMTPFYEQSKAAASHAPEETPQPKRRGRPKGSVNKPKPKPVYFAEPEEVEAREPEVAKV